MACGTGSCRGCVVDTTRGKLRVCSEGPVFALDEVRGRRAEPLEPDQVTLPSRLGPLRLEHPLVDASGTFDILEYAVPLPRGFLRRLPLRRVCAQDGHRRRAHGQSGAARHRDPRRDDRRHRPRKPRHRRLDRGAARMGGAAETGDRERGWQRPRPVRGRRPALEAHLASAPAGAAPRVEGYGSTCPVPTWPAVCRSAPIRPPGRRFRRLPGGDDAFPDR